MKTAEGVSKAVINGFKPFMKEVGPRGISASDIEHLLKIPIRRISLYDINRAKTEMEEIEARIKAINSHLKNIVAYAVSFLDSIIAKIKANEEVGRGIRKTKVGAFDKVDVKEVMGKDVQIKYDAKTGYVGTAVQGEVVAEVSSFDRIIVVRKEGSWFVADIPEKTFVGPGAWYIGAADKEVLSNTVFTVIYKDKDTGYPCIKRCVIEGWIMNKEYSLVGEGATVLYADTRQKFSFTVYYKPKPRLKKLEETFRAQDYSVRGLKANGIRLASKEALRAGIKK
jgi:topoisomerase-4 subunit A